MTIHENPEPSMGAGKVSSLSLASAVSASIARSTTASFVGGLLGSLAGGTIIAARNRQRDLRTSLIPAGTLAGLGPEGSSPVRWSQASASIREPHMGAFYAVARVIARFWIWFFFERVEVRHLERVPLTGPVLLCINHPNNLIDSLLVGTVVARKVHYIATAALFRNGLSARLLAALGVIPVYCRADDRGRADRNRELFAACRRAFDRGRLIAIYPEGATRAEAHVQRIKTGAARIALGYEAHAPRGVVVVTVGLTFEARRQFRGRVIVSFSTPIVVAPYVAVYRDEPLKAIHALTTTLQRSMEREIVQVEGIDAAALARAVQTVYHGELEHELWDAAPLATSRTVADAVEHLRERAPERAERLWRRILGYRAGLAAYHPCEDEFGTRLERPCERQPVARSWQTIVSLPLFAYGAAVNFVPYYLPAWLAGRMSRKPTDYATIRLLASVVAFPLFWSLETFMVGCAAGLGWALGFFVSLPLGGLIAYRYLTGTGRLRHQLRFGALLVTRAQIARRLLAERREIVAELENAKRDYLVEVESGKRQSLSGTLEPALSVDS
ncbi:MAG TPA: 1-acyl-sn-glycerol-3-phosphate acyltransferase [Methylomirabilota bacterium]|nr:1-acyl-sn-glycerol-3-phosphate acyltransferase [Methylomirabilota bacterium]